MLAPVVVVVFVPFVPRVLAILLAVPMPATAGTSLGTVGGFEGETTLGFSGLVGRETGFVGDLKGEVGLRALPLLGDRTSRFAAVEGGARLAVVLGLALVVVVVLEGATAAVRARLLGRAGAFSFSSRVATSELRFLPRV